MTGMASDFIIHYNRSEPFRSVTSHDKSQWPKIVSELHENNSWGLTRFKDERYLQSRCEVELRMYNTFIEMGGKPKNQNPFYFFLGRNSNFESNQKNIGYKVYLKNLSSDIDTFTYGDSLLGFDEYNRSLSGEKYKNNLCSQIYTLSNLKNLLSEIPQVDPLHIEAQLWMKPSAELVHQIDRRN